MEYSNEPFYHQQPCYNQSHRDDFFSFIGVWCFLRCAAATWLADRTTAWMCRCTGVRNKSWQWDCSSISVTYNINTIPPWWWQKSWVCGPKWCIIGVITRSNQARWALRSPWIEPWLPITCWGQWECEVPASSNRSRHPSMDSWLLPHTAEGPAVTARSIPCHTVMHSFRTYLDIKHITRNKCGCFRCFINLLDEIEYLLVALKNAGLKYVPQHVLQNWVQPHGAALEEVNELPFTTTNNFNYIKREQVKQVDF